MGIFGSVGLAECDKNISEPVRSLTFQCKCGCELFNIEIYADHSHAHAIKCAACGQICAPTEPMMNGPH